jgi:hypothetical protein
MAKLYGDSWIIRDYTWIIPSFNQTWLENPLQGLHFWEDRQWWMFQGAMFDYERVSTVMIHVLAVIFIF